MNLTPYQFLTPLVSLFAITYAWNLVLRHNKTVWEAMLWTVFWGFVASIALYPNILSYLTTLTGIRNQENAIFVTTIGILFFTVFYLIVRLEKLEQRIVKLVRKIALKDANIQSDDQEND